jgi:ubiquinone/menaquinone biosynthesis C-methylase UbiE
MVEREARRTAIELAGVNDGESILEIAVGTGLSFQKLVSLNRTGQSIGIDLTPAMLAKAARRMKRSKLDAKSYSLQPGDAYQLNFPDGTFDLVVNSYMFDLLEESDFVKVLQEFRRVVKPGGRLVLVYLTLPRRWYQGIWNTLYRIHPFFLGGCRDITLQPSLEDAGLAVNEVVFVSQMTFPSEILVCQRPV